MITIKKKLENTYSRYDHVVDMMIFLPGANDPCSTQRHFIP